MRQIAAQAAEIAARGFQFAGRDEDFAVREVRKAAVMVHVQMAENDPFHIARPDAERAQLRTDLLLMLDAECDLPPHERVKRLAGFEQMRALAGVDDDDAFIGIDDPRIGRQPFGPFRTGKDRKAPPQSMPTPLDLSRLDADRTGLNRANFHGASNGRGNHDDGLTQPTQNNCPHACSVISSADLPGGPPLYSALRLEALMTG